MEYDMKLSFDVYTKNLDNATMAYVKLDAICKEIRMAKGKRYDSEVTHYNLYGSVDTADVSTLHDAFKEGFVDDSDDV